MTLNKAKQTMESFLKKYTGKTVFFHTLSDDEKLAYIMVDSFNYFKFLKLRDRLERAISNAEAHKESNFKHYAIYTGEAEHMIISKE